MFYVTNVLAKVMSFRRLVAAVESLPDLNESNAHGVGEVRAPLDACTSCSEHLGELERFRITDNVNGTRIVNDTRHCTIGNVYEIEGLNFGVILPLAASTIYNPMMISRYGS